MTKSNNEWVPEIDSQCEFIDNFGEWHKVTITGRGRNLTLFIEEGTTNEQCTLTHKHKFRPIKTEAEKRRDEQLHQMQIDGFRGYGYSLASHTEVKICKNLLDAGWCKPKPLTECVISRLAIDADRDFNVFATLIETYIRGEG